MSKRSMTLATLVATVLATAVASADSNNYLYGYASGFYVCSGAYGATPDIHIKSNVLQYCPYGGNSPNMEKFARDEMDHGNMFRQAQMHCVGGNLTLRAPVWVGAIGERAIAEQRRANDKYGCDTNRVCDSIDLSTYVP